MVIYTYDFTSLTKSLHEEDPFHDLREKYVPRSERINYDPKLNVHKIRTQNETNGKNGRDSLY